MIRLDDELPHADSVGLQASDFKLDDMSALDRLLKLGLTERVEGWQSVASYRLTERGRKLRDEGEA